MPYRVKAQCRQNALGMIAESGRVIGRHPALPDSRYSVVDGIVWYTNGPGASPVNFGLHSEFMDHVRAGTRHRFERLPG